jgi:poly(hydroxyalkanoate) depolymerase family esterase
MVVALDIIFEGKELFLMNDFQDSKQNGMAEATRLMRAGRLAEATAVIQRTLGMPLHNVEPDAEHDNPAEQAEQTEPIEVSYRIIQNDSPHEDTSSAGTDTSMRGTVYGSTKPMRPAEPFMGRPDAMPGNDSPGIWKTLKSLLKGKNYEPKAHPEESLSSARARGKFIDGAFTNAAGTRTYKLYIPTSYDGQAMPLVVMLHGCTQSSVDFANGTRMNELAEKDGFFVVYPEQLQSANNSKCWNWFQPNHQRRDAGEPSLIAGITQKIMTTYNIDRSRVYIGGMSSGGAMSAIMAATYPDIYAAVGVHSGLAYGAAHDLPSGFAAMKKGAARHKQRLTRAVPLILFHGDRDTTVSKVNADHIRDQWLQGAGNNGGSPAEARIDRGNVAGGHAYTRSTHYDKDGRAILDEWIVHHAGHAWSGGSSRGSYTDPKGPDASAEMARFFSKHSRGN